MRVALVAAGRLRAGPERDLVNDYLRRAEAVGRAATLTPIDEIEVEAKARGPAGETEALLAAVPEGRLIALDERGENLGSEALSRKLAAWRDQGARATSLLIGGADGLAEPARARADLVVAFGRQTWPHRLVRVMAAEQVYRAATLLAGAPYHRS